MTESLSIPAMHLEFLLKALNTSCCKRRAAQRLGITERTLYRLQHDYQIKYDKKLNQYISYVQNKESSNNATTSPDPEIHRGEGE